MMLKSIERKEDVLGKKAIRSINVDWDIWYEAKRILKAEGYSLSEAIEGFLKRVIDGKTGVAVQIEYLEKSEHSKKDD